jgi:hypothetical protein
MYSDQLRSDPLSFVIQRRIALPLAAVHSGLADRTPLEPCGWLRLDPGGALHVREAFRPVAPFGGGQTTPTWCAPADVLTSRGRRVAAVEIEVSMWSHDSTELALRPVARHPERWSGPRMKRYFALAHASADAVARLLASRAFTATHTPRVDALSSTERAHERVGAQ